MILVVTIASSLGTGRSTHHGLQLFEGRLLFIVYVAPPLAYLLYHDLILVFVPTIQGSPGLFDEGLEGHSYLALPRSHQLGLELVQLGLNSGREDILGKGVSVTPQKRRWRDGVDLR